MSTTGRPDLPPGKPEAFAAIMTPPASPNREDRIERGISVARVIGSPGFPASDAELRATVERGVDRAPYGPAGLTRQMAAVIAAPPRNDRLIAHDFRVHRRQATKYKLLSRHVARSLQLAP